MTMANGIRTVGFGRGGPQVAAIGQGTWYFEQLDRPKGVAALRRGIELGLTHIDTAEMYGDGIAEEIVGEALAGRRDNVFLVSKVLPWNAGYADTIAACESSLRRLKTGHLDCYLLHWPGQHPLEETFKAMDRLVQDGKIRSFGVSNFDVADLEDAVAVIGDGRLACNQVLYHLRSRAIEHEVLPWCAAHGISVVGYSPFGHDAFPDTKSQGWPVLQSIASAHAATGRQIALAFLARHPEVLLIPKSANLQHLAANAEAAAITLSDGEIAQISAAFPLGRKPSSLPML